MTNRLARLLFAILFAVTSAAPPTAFAGHVRAGLGDQATTAAGPDRSLLPSLPAAAGGPFGSAQGRRGAFPNRTLIALPPLQIVQAASDGGGAYSGSRLIMLPPPRLAPVGLRRTSMSSSVAAIIPPGVDEQIGTGMTRALVAGVPQTITVEVNPASLVANSGSTAVVTATVVDSDGAPVSGVPLSGSTDPSTLGLISDLGTTDTNGQAVGSWTAGNTLGSGLLRVTNGAFGTLLLPGSISGTAPVSLIAGVPFTLTLQANPASLAVGGSSALTATVTDPFGNFVADGTSVVFTTTLGSVLSPRTTTNGVATSSISSTLAGTALITATSGAAQAIETVVFNPGVPATITLQVNPNSQIAKSGTTAVVTATVVDQFNNPVSGVALSGSSDPSALGGVSLPSPTNASGRASGSWTAGTSVGSGLLRVTNGSVTGTAPVSLIAGAPFTLTLQASPASLTVGGSSALTAAVTDQFGNFVADGTSVVFTTTLGSVLSPRTTTSGVATSSISSTIAGSALITATSGAAQAIETVVFNPGVPATITVQVNPNSQIAKSGTTAIVTATVVDQFNNPVSGVALSGSADPSTLGGVSLPSPTNASGRATGSWTAGTSVGSGLLRVTNGSVTGTAPVSLIAGAPFTLTLQANPTSLVVGGSSALTATVTDQFGNFVANGSVVTFATSLGNLLPPPRTTTNGVATSSISSTLAGTALITATSGATARDTESVVFNPGPLAAIIVMPNPVTVTVGASQAFTASGQDQYGNPVSTSQMLMWTTNGGEIGKKNGMFTAQTTPASGRLVTATDNTISGTAVVNIVAGPPAAITVQVNPNSQIAKSGTTAVVTATVVDAFDNPLSGVTLTGSTDPSTLGPISGLGATDANGRSFGTWTAGNTVGSGLLRVTNGSVTGTAPVSLIAGAPFTLTLQANPTSLTVGSSSALTATVTDQFGNFVANGSGVTFATNLGNLLPPPRTTTNGVATSSISSTLAGTALITATSGAAQDTASVVFNPGAPFTLTLQASPISLTVGSSSALTATVTDPFGNPVANGTVVTFATSLGNLLPPPRTTTNGVATSSISSTIAGSAFITATSGATARDTETVIFTPGPFVRLRIEDAPAGLGAEVGAITLTLYDTPTFYAVGYDQYDNLIGAQSVAWGATGVLSGRLAPVSGISTTLTPAPILSGTGFVTTTAGGITDTTGLITIQAPVLRVGKSDSPDPATPGQVLQYTIVYSNIGTAATQNAVITETYPAGTTFLLAVPSPTPGTNNVWAIGSLAPGLTSTIQVFVQLASQFPMSSVLTNTVRFGGPKVTTAIFTTTTQVNSAPDVTISKTAFPDPVRVGDLLVYTIQYQNNGDAPVTGIRITETYPSQVTFVTATPAPSIGNNVWLTDSLSGGGQTKIINVTVRVNSPLGDQTILSNRVTIDTNETTPFTSTEVTLVVAPVIALTKSASPSSPAANSVLTYTLRYTNSGSTYASNVVVTDAVPLSTTYLSCAPSGCSQFAGIVRWNIAAVGPGGTPTATGQLTLRVRVDNNLANGTILTNTARIVAAENVSAFVRITNTVSSAPQLSLSTGDGQSRASAGEVLTYSLTYDNSGNAPAQNVVITDSIPSNVTFQRCAPSCTHLGGGVYSFILGTLGADTGGTVTLTVRVNPTLPAGLRAITNTATIRTTTPGDDPADNVDHDVDTIGTVPKLDIRVAFDKATPYPTKIISYTLRYTNTSAMDTTGVVISVTQSKYITSTPPGWTFAGIVAGAKVYTRSVGNLAAGASGTAMFRVSLPFSYPLPYPPGMVSFVNVFLIHDDGPGGLAVASDVANETLGVPDLVVERVTLSPRTATAGTTFTATVVIRNQGTGTACNPDAKPCGAFNVNVFIDPPVEPPSLGFSQVVAYGNLAHERFITSLGAGKEATVTVKNLTFTANQSPILYFKVDNWDCGDGTPCIPDDAVHGLVPESNENNNVRRVDVPAYQIFMPVIAKNAKLGLVYRGYLPVIARNRP